MKSLLRTIDKILKIEPDLQSQLVPIKTRYKKNPQKTMDYWHQLLDVLNSDYVSGHPKKEEIRNVLVTRRIKRDNFYTFEEVTSQDQIVSVLPEYIADKIKRHDKISINLAKMQVEANMTHNVEMNPRILRKAALLEISLKKMWIELKDLYGLWDKGGFFTIKKKDSMLVLINNIQENLPPSPSQGPFGFIGIDPRLFTYFLRQMGFKPPGNEQPGNQNDE